MTPRAALTDALGPLLPAGWRVLASERAADSTDGTEVVLSQRTIRRHPAAGTWNWEVEFMASITVPGTNAETAEDSLDDDMLVFIKALDDAGIVWGDMNKATIDGRLGYQGTIRISARREE